MVVEVAVDAETKSGIEPPLILSFQKLNWNVK
jgi:hypothetical protein